VVYEVLPQLENLFMALQRLQQIWNTPQNGIPTKIGTAAMTGQALGGYAPTDWVRWGETLLALDTFLTTPIEINLPDGSTETVTPKSVLLTRYVPMEG
jgi:hypothetical protein